MLELMLEEGRAASKVGGSLAWEAVQSSLVRIARRCTDARCMALQVNLLSTAVRTLWKSCSSHRNSFVSPGSLLDLPEHLKWAALVASSFDMRTSSTLRELFVNFVNFSCGVFGEPRCHVSVRIVSGFVH